MPTSPFTSDQTASAVPSDTSSRTVPAHAPTALELDGVTLTYPDGAGTLTALDEVSLRVGAGQMLALVGPSGSGKSSLLAVAATLVQPQHGVVSIAGRDAAQLSRRGRDRLRRDEIGMIFQQPNLLPSLTSREQLIIAEDMRGGARRSAAARADALLEEVGLTDAAGRRPHELSGGMRQRVNIARALIGSPSVLLVDEPTAALDHDRSLTVVQLLARLTAEHQVATVMVTHDTEYVPVADAVATMRDGALSRPEPTDTGKTSWN
ncbi:MULTISPECIES: ABC transporter ATP-binding protein [Actinomycetes]|uniref:ABC transporter ATP-binding protein n=2 Tax=Actinomycetes TaxID=1760 RepID=A0ABP6M2G5_9MICC|nr:ABC transporter ATP-binding protein [Nesterenkonia sp. PF2B19]OSM43328.1 ABC transporter ATP-binding protein [Nesterenkonia sp. PF2B19]